MRIIPAIDIIEGKCVRLEQGDYARQKTYNEDPLEVAQQFEDAGLQFLHLVDLDGAKSKHIVNYKVLEKLASKTHLQIDFGGGIKSDDDIRIVFNSGAQQVTVGSVAVTDRELFLGWLQQFGAEKIILSADAKNGKIATHGWKEESEQELLPFLKNYFEKGIQWAMCTDISKDGMLQGTAVDLYEEIKKELPELKLIASGGVTSMSDVEKLAELKMAGTIIGKAIYEGKIQLNELSNFVLKNAD